MRHQSVVATLLVSAFIGANTAAVQASDLSALPPSPNRIMLKPGECSARVLGAPPAYWFCASGVELEEMRAEVSRLKEQLSQSQTDNSRLLSEAEVAEKQLADVQNRFAEARETGQGLRDQLEATKLELEQQIQSLRKQLAAAEKKYIETVSDLSALQEQLDTERAQRQSVETEQAALQQRLAQTEQELADVRSSAEAAQQKLIADLDQKQTRVVELEQQLQSLREQHVAAEKMHGGTVAELNALQEQLDAERAQRQSLETDKAALQRQLAQSEQAQADILASGEAEQQRLTANLKQKQAKVAGLEQELQSLQEQIAGQKQENSAAVSRLTALQEQLESERAQAEQFAQAALEDKARLERQLAAAVSSSQALKQKHKKEAATAAAQLQQLSSREKLFRQLLGDADQDGVVDPRDLCPETAGEQSVDGSGCGDEEEIVLQGVTFASGSAELSRESLRVLEAVAVKINNHPGLLFEIAGHTDASGDAELNQRISARRAAAVKEYLVEKGVSADRLSTKGYGQEHPIADNDTPAGRASNRRVSLIPHQ